MMELTSDTTETMELEKTVRPTWKEYFFDITELVAKRSTCTKRSVGAIIVSPDKRILATGYNGAPKKSKHCTNETCLRRNIPSGESLERCKAVHAEANCIAQAAAYGVNIEGSVLYCTHKPCFGCIKLLINAGIKTVYYKNNYPSDLTDNIVAEADVDIELIAY